jgi:hypothetical protein
MVFRFHSSFWLEFCVPIILRARMGSSLDFGFAWVGCSQLQRLGFG